MAQYSVLSAADVALLSRVVNAATYCPGNGTIQTTAIAAALAACTSSQSEVVFPDGEYRLDGTVTIPSAVRRITLGANAKFVQTVDAPIFSQYGDFGNAKALSGTIDKGSKTLSMDDTSLFNEGDWIFLRGGDLTPNITAGSRVGMIRRIVGKTETLLYLDAPVYRNITNTISIRQALLGKRVVFSGGTYTHIDQSNISQLLNFMLCEGPDFNGVTIRDSGGPAINMAATVGGSFNQSHVFNLTDDLATNHYGYGVNLAGPSRGFSFNSGTVGKVRHAITTNSISGTIPSNLSVLSQRGEPEDCYYGPVYCYSTSEAALDCHGLGYGITMTPNVHGCTRGIGIRCGDVTINGGQVVGSLREAIITLASSEPNDGTNTIDIACNGLSIIGVAEDNAGVADSTAVNIATSGVTFRATGLTVKGYAEVGVRTVAGAKFLGRNCHFDGLAPNGHQIAVKFEGSGNRLNGGTIRNTDIGIREESGATDNEWHGIEFTGNTTNESRVPTYTPPNRHNKPAGAGGILNDHEVPFSFFRPGKYYSAGGFGGGSGTSSALGADSLRMTPLYVRNRTALDRIGAEVTSAGSTGSVVRLGIYSDTGEGYPGSLILDAGTIDGTTVGAQEKTINVTLEPGLYWLGATQQGGPTTQPTMRTTTGVCPSIGSNSLSSNLSGAVGYLLSPVAAALPLTITAGTPSANAAHKISVRAA